MAALIYGNKKKVIGAIKLRQKLKNFDVSIEKEEPLLIVQDNELVLNPYASIKANFEKNDDETLLNAIRAKLDGFVLVEDDEWLEGVVLCPFARIILFKHIDDLSVGEAISIFITLTSFAREGLVFLLYLPVLFEEETEFFDWRNWWGISEYLVSRTLSTSRLGIPFKESSTLCVFLRNRLSHFG